MNCFHAPFAAVKIWKQIELEKLWTVFAFNAIHAVRKDLLDLLRLKRSKIGTRGTLSVEERIIDEEFSGYGKPWDPRETDALPPLTPWEQWRLAVSISIMLPREAIAPQRNLNYDGIREKNNAIRCNRLRSRHRDWSAGLLGYHSLDTREEISGQ